MSEDGPYTGRIITFIINPLVSMAYTAIFQRCKGQVGLTDWVFLGFPSSILLSPGAAYLSNNLFVHFDIIKLVINSERPP